VFDPQQLDLQTPEQQLPLPGEVQSVLLQHSAWQPAEAQSFGVLPPHLQIPGPGLAVTTQVLPPVQALLQPLQSVSVPSGVSQPSVQPPVQFAKPASQVRTQLPVEQVALALAGAVHGVAHAPQSTAVLSGASQPFPQSLSQFPEPALQLLTQLPVEQLAVPLVGLEHGVPHAPQLAAVLSDSQPLPQLPSQLSHVALQLLTQLPVEQLAVPFDGALQAVPQVMQLVPVLSGSQPLPQLESQLSKPPLQLRAQLPVLQSAPSEVVIQVKPPLLLR